VLHAAFAHWPVRGVQHGDAEPIAAQHDHAAARFATEPDHGPAESDRRDVDQNEAQISRSSDSSSDRSGALRSTAWG
jgi:hypothetical protein